MKTVFEEFKTHYHREHVITDYPGENEPIKGEMQVSTGLNAAYDEERGVLVIDFNVFTTFRAPLEGPGVGRYISADPQPPEKPRVLVSMKDPAEMIRFAIKTADDFYALIVRWCVVMGKELHHVVPPNGQL